MLDRKAILNAMEELRPNREQFSAVNESGHCVVLAGPGSGKTKTLATAIAKTLLLEVSEPRGIACITYSNECALELRARLSLLGVEDSERVFIGTVHSFALTKVILPYARCALPEFPISFRVATEEEQRDAKRRAYRATINAGEDPIGRWKFAEPKRRKYVDRSDPSWRTTTPDLTRYIEAYEADLRRQGLIDFDDMSLFAVKMIRSNAWIRSALLARFPTLFVDEYQDLGYPLDDLVRKLCFNAGIRLFAVGDIDQSIYGFTGANPELLEAISLHANVTTYRLKLNYRSGSNIIAASMAALGEDRLYEAFNSSDQGQVFFEAVDGGLPAQASIIADVLIPRIIASGVAPEEIAVLYRSAGNGDIVSDALHRRAIPYVRSDTNAIVPRGSRLGRFLEACAQWVTGGWAAAEPRFSTLLYDAVALVYGPGGSNDEHHIISGELISFLMQSRGRGGSASAWLADFRDEVLEGWRRRSTGLTNDWHKLEGMIARLNSEHSDPMLLTHFAGRIGSAGRVNLSTLHSSKGREFDVVIIAPLDSNVMPNYYESRTAGEMREARRIFYVGVTRARKALFLTYNRAAPSRWVGELERRLNEEESA